MIVLISISNISQQSINKEKDLREQLDKLREQNKDLENVIERKQAKLERLKTQCKEDIIQNGKEGTRQNDIASKLNIDITKNATLHNKNKSTLVPTLNYEITRRRLRRDVNEFWWYIKAAMKKSLNENFANAPELLEQTLSNGKHRHNTLLSILEELENQDGFNDWREMEHQELSNLVRMRLHS